MANEGKRKKKTPTRRQRQREGSDTESISNPVVPMVNRTAAQRAEDAQKERDDTMMQRFDTMQATMSKAFSDQNAANMANASALQKDMLADLIPKLLTGQPKTTGTTGPNAFTSGTGSFSHLIPSTGLIAAAASSYDAQLPALGHLVGDLSSGITAESQGNSQSINS
jgi:hypothetical protein